MCPIFFLPQTSKSSSQVVAQLPTKMELKKKPEFMQKLNKIFVSKIFILLSNLTFYRKLI